MCHDIQINDDDDCEITKDFFSKLDYIAGDSIILTRNTTRIIINSTTDPECGKHTVYSKAIKLVPFRTDHCWL